MGKKIITRQVIYLITNIFKALQINCNRFKQKKTELKNTDLKQQIRFTGRLEKYEEAAMFFIIEKSEETTFEFTQDAETVV